MDQKEAEQKGQEIINKCRENYGEAHDAHMAVNGECPWCGTYDPNQTDFLSVEEAEEMFG